MANTITEVLPKLLAQGLLALRQNVVLPRLINTDLQDLAAQKGNIINVPIPSAIAARDVTPAVSYAANVDSAPTSVAVTLDFWKEAPFQMSDNDIVSAMDGVIPMQASEAIKALANAVDSYILGKHVGIFGMAGTPGTTPFNASLTMAATARKLLNRQLAPVDNRRAVLDPDAEANLLLNTQVLQFDQRGDAEGIIQGSIGRKLGVDWYMDQNITSTYTPGTGWASGNIASTVGGAIGDTTLNIINATASGSIKVGDIFTLTADTQARQYVIVTNATISLTVASAIKFYPPLLSAVATGATLIVVSVPYVPNLMFHRDAFAWASRRLSGVVGVGDFQSVADPVSGIVLRLELSRQYKQTTFSYDVLGGANLVRRELAVKIAG